jgi:putative ABC transport system permease protein
MRRLRQIRIVCFLGLRSLRSRLKSAWVIIVALMFVSVVLLSILCMEEGIRRDYLGVGHTDRAIILSAGAQQEMSSAIPRSWVGQIAAAPGIRTENGKPLVDGQTYAFVDTVIKRSNQKRGYTGVLGIGAKGFRMSPEIKLIDGRNYRSGTREVIVGVVAQREFSGLDIGDKIRLLDGGEWTVVGHFATDTFLDGDLIADPDVMSVALRRSTYSAVLVSLRSAQVFDEFKTAIAANPALSVTVERQSDYWLRHFRSLPDTPLLVAYVISVLLASGAVSGILHTMHATVSSRATEIAILRAVGFGGLPVAVSIVLEAMIFASIGAAIGTAIVWLWLDGYAINGAYGVFRAAVTPHLLLIAVGWGLVTAFIGAIVPAAQEGRMPVVEALARL